MKVIQVGAGAWGESWIGVVQNSPQWELAALADVDETARKNAAAAGDLSPDLCFAELGDALEAGVEADAALVIVPPPYHAPVAVHAVDHGLHCLLEKPLADTMSAARDIIQAAKRTGRIAMVSQNYRFKRTPRTVQRVLTEGVVGEVEQVKIDFQKDPPFEGFRLEMEEPLIVDFLIHHMDQIRGIVGLEPTKLRARSWNPSWSRFDGNACCLIEMETARGVQIVYTGSWVSHGRHTTWDGEWDIQGTRGGLLWTNNRVEVRLASLFDTVFMPGALEREGIMEVQLDEVDLEERLGTLAEFASAIEEGRSAETNAQDNFNSMALVLAALESARTGGKEMDLKAFKSL